MKVSCKMFHRVCLASAVVFVAVPIIGGTLPAPKQPATNATGQQSQCMRRVTVTSKPCGADLHRRHEVGRTYAFSDADRSYTLIVFAPGHKTYAQRIWCPMPREHPSQLGSAEVRPRPSLEVPVPPLRRHRCTPDRT
jgi:hypothetical protein